VMDRLHIVDPILEDKTAGGGVFVTFSDVTTQSATVRIRTEVRNEHLEPRDCQVLHQLIDPGGHVVGNASASSNLAAGGETIFQQTINVTNPRLWHPHHPHLYELRTIVMGNDQPADEVTSRIGIRHIGLTANEA